MCLYLFSNVMYTNRYDQFDVYVISWITGDVITDIWLEFLVYYDYDWVVF